jgi:hypothetical protein
MVDAKSVYLQIAIGLLILKLAQSNKQVLSNIPRSAVDTY